MSRRFAFPLIVIALIFLSGETASFAQFGGRGGFGGIFGGPSRSRRGANTPNQGRPSDQLVPDLYDQTEHQLTLMEVDLQLSPDQQEPWHTFAQKVRTYAADLSRERARMGLPLSEGTAVSGLRQIDELIDSQRNRTTELEEIRTAANTLYATFSSDQKKIADTRMHSIFSPPRRESNSQ